MKTIRLFTAIALLVLVGSAAFAGYTDNVTAPGQSWSWDLSSWQPNESGTCQLDLDLNWYLPQVGPDSGYAIGGHKDSDPVVNQVVTNYSTLTWSDWHVQLINGRIREGSAMVKREGSSEAWNVTYGAVPGYDSGFTAIAWPPADLVGQNGRLSVYFIFDPIDPSQRVSIKQWPTTDFVPEPGSLVALGMGLTSLGFGLRRRVK